MKQYLYLPYRKCKNCKHFDESSTRAYDKCHVRPKCPAFDVGIVIENSVTDLANQYKRAMDQNDLSALFDILNKVKASGKAFAYKFKQEIKK